MKHRTTKEEEEKRKDYFSRANEYFEFYRVLTFNATRGSPLLNKQIISTFLSSLSRKTKKIVFLKLTTARELRRDFFFLLLNNIIFPRIATNTTIINSQLSCYYLQCSCRIYNANACHNFLKLENIKHRDNN